VKLDATRRNEQARGDQLCKYNRKKNEVGVGFGSKSIEGLQNKERKTTTYSPAVSGVKKGVIKREHSISREWKKRRRAHIASLAVTNRVKERGTHTVNRQ